MNFTGCWHCGKEGHARGKCMIFLDILKENGTWQPWVGTWFVNTKLNEKHPQRKTALNEIQRLIGRSLRAAIPAGLLEGKMLQIDCDVIQADGGTRCAAITGGWIALAIALMTKNSVISVERLYSLLFSNTNFVETM